LTVPETAWTAGKFVTSTCAGFAGAACAVIPAGLTVFRSSEVTLTTEIDVMHSKTNPRITTFRMVYLSLSGHRSGELWLNASGKKCRIPRCHRRLYKLSPESAIRSMLTRNDVVPALTDCRIGKRVCEG
jgi:hypothetical protein